MAANLPNQFRTSMHTRIQQQQRRRHAIFLSTVSVFLFVAFVLLLLVALSMPIIKPVYLLSLVSTTPDLEATSIATEVRFGVWGYCATSVLDVPTIFTNNGQCSSPRLGYAVSNAILALTGQPQLLEIVLKALIAILVLHPICAGIALVALICALVSFIHAFAIMSLILTIVAALVTSLVAAIDIAVVAVAMNKVGDITQFSFRVKWGNAPWMTLVSAVLLWLVIILQSVTVCGCCGYSQRLWTRIDYGDEKEEKATKA